MIKFSDLSQYYRSLTSEEIMKIVSNARSLLNRDLSEISGMQHLQFEKKCKDAIRQVGLIIFYRDDVVQFVNILEKGLESQFDNVKWEAHLWLGNFAQKHGYQTYSDYKKGITSQQVIQEKTINETYSTPVDDSINEKSMKSSSDLDLPPPLLEQENEVIDEEIVIPMKKSVDRDITLEKKIFIEKNPITGSLVYECHFCSEPSSFYCPQCGIIFCKKCASKEVRYCVKCGTGYNPSRIRRLSSQCGLISTSQCPKCEKPLIVIYYTRGGKFYRYMLECLSCGWHSAMSREEGGQKLGVREKTVSKAILRGIEKGYVSSGTNSNSVCKGNIINKGCPHCYRNSLFITDLLPMIDYEIMEAEKIGNELPLCFYITNMHDPCDLTFMLNNIAFFTVNMTAPGLDEYQLIFKISSDFHIGILPIEIQLKLKFERYSKPCICKVRILSCFILPEIDAEILPKELHFGTHSKLPIQISNLSPYSIDDVRVIFEMNEDFQIDESIKAISQVDPDETRAVIFDVTPLVMGLFGEDDLDPARISFKIPDLFGSIVMVVKSDLPEFNITSQPETLPAQVVSSTDESLLLEKLDVSIKRQYEYLGGFVRIKGKIDNNSLGVITDIVFRLDVPENYKMRTTEPKAYLSIGTAVKIPNIRPNESKSVAFYLEPLICGHGRIHGDVKFYDSLGNPQIVVMRPLEITVVCPLFFTEEEANIAKLKHLLDYRLDKRDVRCYKLPNNLDPSRATSLIKEVIQKHHVRFVSEIVQEEPFDAEVWYYGKSKVKKKDFVIVGKVCSERSAIEVKVGCSDEEQLVGLLAELGSELRKAIVREGVVASEIEIRDLRCPQCGAPIPRLPELGETIQCFSCDSFLTSY